MRLFTFRDDEDYDSDNDDGHNNDGGDSDDDDNSEDDHKTWPGHHQNPLKNDLTDDKKICHSMAHGN